MSEELTVREVRPGMASEFVRQNQGGFPHHCKQQCPWRTGGIQPLTKIAIRRALRARTRVRSEPGSTPRGSVATKSTLPRGLFGALHVHHGTSALCRDSPAAAVGWARQPTANT